MMELTNERDLLFISIVYSYLGQMVLSGDVEALKYLYGNAWQESPPLIRTISQLQCCLTAVEIENDTTNVYNDEFLYYWGMICIGEISQLIFKDLGTAEICFKKSKKAAPQAEARLAFIGLHKSDEFNKSDSNIKRLEILRTYANKRDFFSSIVLAKIIYYQFLDEQGSDTTELPTKALRLLASPCQYGHPVAIKLYNSMRENMTQENAPDISCGKISNLHACTSILYDFPNPMQICK